MDIKRFLESIVSADVSAYYTTKKQKRMSSLQKAVIIYNSKLSPDEKSVGFRELIETETDEPIPDLVLHIPYFAMPHVLGITKDLVPTETKNGFNIYDLGDEIYDYSIRSHIIKGWCSLHEYLLLLINNKLTGSKRRGLGGVPFNLMLERKDKSYDFVYSDGDLLEYREVKFIVYNFSKYPNGSISYQSLYLTPSGYVKTYSSTKRNCDNEIYGDNDIYHTSKVKISDLHESDDLFLVELGKFVAKYPDTSTSSLCELFDAYSHCENQRNST